MIDSADKLLGGGVELDFRGCVTKGNADVVNLGYLDGTVVEEAVKEGVVVYEHNV